MHSVNILNNLKNQLQLDPKHSNIMLVGIGITGLSVARFLQAQGFTFAIADSREEPPMLEEMAILMPHIKVYNGPFKIATFNGITHLIVSPGVSLQEATLRQVIGRSVRLLSDIDLFVCANEKPIVAITGSNGKSTVTTMLGKMAAADGKNVALGGNLGIPALDLLSEQVELYVLELSSFQLERTTLLNAAAACVLNVTPDHMDRYCDIYEYAEQKRRIFMGRGVMVLNVDDPLVSAMQDRARTCITFGVDHDADFNLQSLAEGECLMHDDQPMLPLRDLPLEGRHNQENALAALALGTAIGLSDIAMCTALRNFQGLEHRSQLVAEINGVKWINDSKATNIGACVAALRGFTRKVILIAGGDAKGADMQDLTSIIKARTRAVVLLGVDAVLIEQALNECVPVYRVENLRQAVTTAATLARPGESVLLSPACSSLDQFKNYQERGNLFAEAVRELAA